MGADHRDHFKAIVGWVLRRAYLPPTDPPPDAWEDAALRLLKLGFWYWLYDRVSEIGHNGSADYDSLKQGFTMQFGGLNGKCSTTFDALLETTQKQNRNKAETIRKRGQCIIADYKQLQGLLSGKHSLERRNRKRYPYPKRIPDTQTHTQNPIPETQGGIVPDKPTVASDPWTERDDELAQRAATVTGEMLDAWRSRLRFARNSFGLTHDQANGLVRDVEAAKVDGKCRNAGAMLNAAVEKALRKEVGSDANT